MIELRMETSIESEHEMESFRDLFKEVAEKKQVKHSEYETIQIMDVCPEGKIIASFEGDFVTIYAQTNVAGPGFHAFVAGVYDELDHASDYEFTITDSTNYYEKRDFEELKYRHFYPWLQNVASFVVEQKQNHVCLCWPQALYEPFGIENHVVTPTGYYSFQDFETEIEELANRFFIWNHLEKDARYYRNCAYALMWKDCFFEYSAMNSYTDLYANQIVDYLEAAYEQDSTIALPYKEYEVICNALHRDVLLHGESANKKLEVGYRKGLVYYRLHDFKIPCSGFSEQSYDAQEDAMSFMAPYQSDDEPWKWHIRANILSAKQGLFPIFDQQESHTFVSSAGEGVYCCFEEGEFLHGFVQINHEEEALFIEILSKTVEDFNQIIEWCHYIYVQPVTNVEKNMN